jgi:prohibitin 2
MFFFVYVAVHMHHSVLTNYLFLQAVSREIRKILTERAVNFNIALDDVSITSLTFGKEFTAAIEAKQVAAQEAERAKFIVEKAEQDKKSAVIRAEVRQKKS